MFHLASFISRFAVSRVLFYSGWFLFVNSVVFPLVNLVEFLRFFSSVFLAGSVFGSRC